MLSGFKSAKSNLDFPDGSIKGGIDRAQNTEGVVYKFAMGLT
jgi:hypothetical protein